VAERVEEMTDIVGGSINHETGSTLLGGMQLSMQLSNRFFFCLYLFPFILSALFFR